jgi:protein-tyrosine kinase
MESIREAVERAKAQSDRKNGSNLRMPARQADGVVADRDGSTAESNLDPAFLQSHRIVAFDGKDTRSRPFDVLRTEVLRAMDMRGWKMLAVTSPTPGCGKTLTAINLAFSMARQCERAVCLVDLDLRRPQVAASIGLRRCRGGVLDVIEGRTDIDSAITVARIGRSQLQVLPTAPCSDTTELVASAAMRTFLQDLTRYPRSGIIILDLPPLMTGHDAISILPQVDCVLLVAAAGTSKISEIEECNRHLQETEVVRFVLNKVTESTTTYYAYY